MKRLSILTLGFAVVLAAGVLARQTTPPPASQSKPEEKSDAKAPPTIVGKWNVSVDSQNGAMVSVLDLKLDGKKVTGTMSGQMGETPVTGQFAEGKLTFNMTFAGQNGDIQVAFTGAFKEDGKLAGTLDYGQVAQGMPAIAWTAERAKEKLQ